MIACMIVPGHYNIGYVLVLEAAAMVMVRRPFQDDQAGIIPIRPVQVSPFG